MRKPVLSVIVPVYNVESYLKRCVDSILLQTFRDFELILIDDGSTDNSSHLCDEYAKCNSCIKVIHQKNGGMSAARNTGIQIAKGDYLSFIDSDDWIDSIMYEEMLAVIDRTDADIVVCGHRVVHTDQTIEAELVSKENLILSRTEATKLILEDELIPSFAWNKLFRRRLFENLRFPIGRIYEDTATIYKLFHVSKKVVIVNQIFYNYLRRTGSICLSDDKLIQKQRMFDNFRAFYERYVFARNNSEYADVLPICACKALSIGLNIVHYAVKNGLSHKDKRNRWVVYSLCDIRLDLLRSMPRKRVFELVLLKFSPYIYFYSTSMFYRIFDR